MARTLLLLVVLHLVATASLTAQRTSQSFEAWKPSLSSSELRAVEQRDSVPGSRGDYRYEGLAFGGVVFGALGAWLGSRRFESCPTIPGADCDGNQDRLGNGIIVGLIGAAVGGGLGYLVGRFSPKRPRPEVIPDLPSPELTSVPDSVRQRVGYQHWRGLGIAAVVGAAAGALAGSVLASMTDDCSDCGEPWSPGRGALVMGLLGAGTGSVVGFLAGLSSPKYEWVRTSP